MHNNIVLDRLRPRLESKIPSPVQIAFQAIQQATLEPPISLDELRAILYSELLIEPIKPEPAQTPKSLHFENIFDFCGWYEENQMKFSPQQREALDTLLLTRRGIDVGCACRRNARVHMAGNYFTTFWVNNKETDLLSTIARITGASQVSISSICVYPR